MLKKTAAVLLIGGSLLFVSAQIFFIVSGMFSTEPAFVPGEEDVVIRNGDREGNQLAFACNVDWGEEVIPELLSICRDKEIRITFFVTGRWAENNPFLLRKMYVAGHEIENHGYGHRLCSKISAEESKEEIRRTENAISELLGIKTTLFAPPSGDYDGKTVELCREMGYLISLWSSDTIDWRKGSSASVIRERIMKKPLAGAIVLMHPKPETAKALPGLIDEIREKGIEIVPAGSLIREAQAAR